VARRVIRGGVLLTALAVSAAAQAACVIDANGELTNPFAPGCGDVILTYTESDNTGANIALGIPVPLPIASLTPVEGFRDYDSLFARWQSLLASNDEAAGEVVGRTLAGRDIWAFAIGDPDRETAYGAAEAAVLINGGIHAREWQTPEAVTALFETLIERKGNGGLEQYLIENLTTVLLPVNNVDGFVQTQLYPDRASADRAQPREGRMRRKNLRNPQTGGAVDADLATTADNFWGVDLNRNAVAGFAQANRSSASVTSLVYRGAAPGSEPEFAALQNAAQLGPAARLRLFSDTHSFGQVHFAPTTGVTRRDALTSQLSARMRAASERAYRFSPDPLGSSGIGSAADHFAFTYQIPSWTFELEPANGAQDYGGLASHGHSGFILPASEVPRMRSDVVRMHLIGFYRQSGPPAALAAQIRDAQNDSIVFDARWSATSTTTRTQVVAINRALAPGRSYRLWVAFDKPMRVRDANGAVVAYPGQSAGVSVGAAALEVPSNTAHSTSLGANAVWLNAPGGAPNGYYRYADDAFAVDFTLPAAAGGGSVAAAVLTLNVRDLAESALDANPATVVDWSAGRWAGYENTAGVEGDSGGMDCSFKPFIATDPDAAPPVGPASCAAAAPPPPAASPAAPRSSGGGASGLAVLVLLLFMVLVLRVRRMRLTD
jgi:Zinc carboxypeptidase